MVAFKGAMPFCPELKVKHWPKVEVVNEVKFSAPHNKPSYEQEINVGGAFGRSISSI